MTCNVRDVVRSSRGQKQYFFQDEKAAAQFPMQLQLSENDALQPIGKRYMEAATRQNQNIWFCDSR